MRLILVISFLFSLLTCSSQHIGFYYSYGANFNFHPLNDSPADPSDGSSLGIYYHLDNGNGALGFRSAVAWKTLDIKFPVPGGKLFNHMRSIELRLQCTLPVSAKSFVFLGLSP